jgi:hypothetical protein
VGTAGRNQLSGIPKFNLGVGTISELYNALAPVGDLRVIFAEGKPEVTFGLTSVGNGVATLSFFSQERLMYLSPYSFIRSPVVGVRDLRVSLLNQTSDEDAIFDSGKTDFSTQPSSLRLNWEKLVGCLSRHMQARTRSSCRYSVSMDETTPRLGHLPPNGASLIPDGRFEFPSGIIRVAADVLMALSESQQSTNLIRRILNRASRSGTPQTGEVINFRESVNGFVESCASERGITIPQLLACRLVHEVLQLRSPTNGVEKPSPNDFGGVRKVIIALTPYLRPDNPSIQLVPKDLHETVTDEGMRQFVEIITGQVVSPYENCNPQKRRESAYKALGDLAAGG